MTSLEIHGPYDRYLCVSKMQALSRVYVLPSFTLNCHFITILREGPCAKSDDLKFKNGPGEGHGQPSRRTTLYRAQRVLRVVTLNLYASINMKVTQ